jgi:hypothetical protein
MPRHPVSASTSTHGPLMAATPNRLRLVLRAVSALLGIAVVVFVAQSLRRDGPGALAAWRTAHVRWGFIALAVGCGFAGHGAYLLGWRRLLKDSDIPVRLWPLAKIFLVSNLGRYLPGADGVVEKQIPWWQFW